jgi:hypothetical protein
VGARKRAPVPGAVLGGGLWRPMSDCGARGELRAGALRLQGESQGHRAAERGRVRLGHLDNVAAEGRTKGSARGAAALQGRRSWLYRTKWKRGSVLLPRSAFHLLVPARCGSGDPLEGARTASDVTLDRAVCHSWCNDQTRVASHPDSSEHSSRFVKPHEKNSGPCHVAHAGPSTPEFGSPPT